jgi:hypothetical protein
MSNVYSTEELIEILTAERHACLTGKRLKLTTLGSSGHPLIDRFIKLDGLQKFAAYEDFKATVHRYQLEHQVSGIIWHQITVKGKMLRYPQVDERLIAIPSDLEALKAAKADILAFWQEVTEEMDLYLSLDRAKDYRSILLDEIEPIARSTEWANLYKWEKSNFLEIVLQLGWGQPQEAAYKRGWPVSGSQYIHAVNPGNLPIA